jgi:uncharacterized membrane protein/YHS domain-containing protein
VSGPSDLSLFFGRFHPVLVHLPIGLILLLAILELLALFPRLKNANSSAGYILALAVPLAGLTAYCGWLLSRGGGYNLHLLAWHKWLGISTAVACALTGLLYALRLRRTYRVCLFSTVLLLVVASDLGGSLTHGSGYLTRYAPKEIRRWLSFKIHFSITRVPLQEETPPPKQRPAVAKAGANGARKTAPVKTTGTVTDGPVVFANVIEPIFKANCVTCHGPDKSKGKLRLDSFAAALKGGDGGPEIVLGKSERSELMRRVWLPIDDDDHMPPDGKPQPSADDLTLLEWWIDSGAPNNKALSELDPPPNISRILASRLRGSEPETKAVPPKPLKEVMPVAAKLSDELGIVITPLAQHERWLQCDARVAGKRFDDSDLAKLAPLEANLRRLDLGGTSVTDAGLATLKAMPNLQRLHLERTAITDAGLGCLANLNHLQYLNLYDTAITDSGLNELAALPKLKQVYLWETKVTPAAAKAFASARLDKEQVSRWEEQIEQLKARIRGAGTLVNIGAGLANATDPPATGRPINTKCPVSGKPIDSSKTVVYKGKVVAFCCDDCKAKFEKDPAPFLAKLGLTEH